jgi:hypothetical protein
MKPDGVQLHLSQKNILNEDDKDMELGPCAVLYDQCVGDCLKHLTDCSTFQHLSRAESHAASVKICGTIETWLQTHKCELDSMGA